MSNATPLRLVTGERNELEISVAISRRFLDIGEREPIELTAFTEHGIRVCHVDTARDQIARLYEAQKERGFFGAYQLVNEMAPELTHRYELNRWSKAYNGRASDKEILGRRALFLDFDAVRPKGISSTDEQLRAAWEVSHAVETWLAEVVGQNAIGHGCSGNGYYALIALQPTEPTPETTQRISGLLALLHRRFGTPEVKIDTAVANAARLMPAAGTWKRKGRNSDERPHRLTSFTCRPNVERVPLEALC